MWCNSFTCKGRPRPLHYLPGRKRELGVEGQPADFGATTEAHT
ncbi:hypothetical protein TcasGA2_TC031571 [Tribolium castaneum]|uniref:Uncharacterized protein n=1 Tax=Tribolium castaneum TaxID=7070 RepID=A0A139WPL0_TRICA|nr:hypothetical protein TcasGA2_TC031571 [Tribolium castaneum]